MYRFHRRPLLPASGYTVTWVDHPTTLVWAAIIQISPIRQYSLLKYDWFLMIQSLVYIFYGLYYNSLFHISALILLHNYL